MVSLICTQINNFEKYSYSLAANFLIDQYRAATDFQSQFTKLFCSSIVRATTLWFQKKCLLERREIDARTRLHSSLKIQL